MAQLENAEIMKHVSSTVDGISKTLAMQTITTNNDIFKQVVTVLKVHILEFLVDDYLSLGAYLTNVDNKQDTILFATLEGLHCKRYLELCLEKINAARKD